MNVRAVALICALALCPTTALAASCRLSTAECSIIAHEMANEEIARIHDDQMIPGYLPELDRKRLAIDRSFSRMKVRIEHLPPAIAGEWTRLLRCDARDQRNLVDPENAQPSAGCD